MLHRSDRVVVAMSGGVDSSVAAYLLKEEGHDVIGISLKVWDYDSKTNGKTCCSFRDIEDARRVCDKIGVPFYAFDYQKEFRQKVIDPFISEYLNGRTPNPCILCNQQIKFGQLAREAEKLGASFLATGHHARVVRDEKGIYHLLKGIDPQKDQSYVLYRLTQNELSRILFPVGDYTKAEIRKIALREQLPTAVKPESQDICFVAGGDHGDFIQRRIGERGETGGVFVDIAGRVLGKHDGIHHFTVGQRRGLGLSMGERTYVIRIEPETKRVVIGSRSDLGAAGLVARDVNWVQPDRFQTDAEYGVKIRYQKNEIGSRIESAETPDGVRVKFSEPYAAVTPGQAAVFYRGDEVIGGGRIERAL